jgi:hypothetical protein
MTKQENLEFLIKLDKEVHYITSGGVIVGGLVRLGGGPGTRRVSYPVDNFRNERKLKVEEVERIMQIVKEEEGVLIYPDNIWTSGLGYRVVSTQQSFPGVDPEIKSLVTFLESQLPAGWDFNKLTPLMKTEKNLRGLKFYNLPEVKHREAYKL